MIQTAKKFRRDCEKYIKELQKVCKHKRTHWCEECWAPAHFTGRRLKTCMRCEKVLETEEASWKPID